jgi:hypothetical protein
MRETAMSDAKPMTLREAKKLVSARLRDPKTDAKSVVRLVGFMSKYGWKRRSSRKRTVQDVVQDMEARARKERVH